MPEDIKDPAVVQPEPPAEPPAKPAEPTPVAEPDTDPYELYKGAPDDKIIKDALDARRGLPKKVRAALDAATNLTMRQRLARQSESITKKGAKYTDEDLATLKAQIEAQYKDQYAPKENDAEFEKFLSSFEDEAQRNTVKKLAEFWKGENKILRKELEGIKSPLERAEAQRKLDEQRNKYNAIVERIVQSVPHINPMTIIDILRENESKPVEEQMNESEILMVAQELQDDMFNDILPKRLGGNDKYTVETFSKAFNTALEKKEAWAVELATSIVTNWQKKKEDVAKGAEPDGAAARPAAAGKSKYSALDFITGRAYEQS